MTVGGFVCEAVGSVAPGATTGIFALADDPDAGWLVDAASAEETIDVEYGTLPRVREVWTRL